MSGSDEETANASATQTPQPKSESRNSNKESRYESDSDSSSSDLDVSYSKDTSWKIDLTTFSKTQTKLDTAINDSRKCGELVQAYFNKKHSSLAKLPWDNERADYGINPLHQLLYAPAKRGEDGSTLALTGNSLYVKLSDAGIAIMSELKTTFKDYFKNNVYTWGDSKGCCIATYGQIALRPI